MLLCDFYYEFFYILKIGFNITCQTIEVLNFIRQNFFCNGFDKSLCNIAYNVFFRNRPFQECSSVIEFCH